MTSSSSPSSTTQNKSLLERLWWVWGLDSSSTEGLDHGPSSKVGPLSVLSRIVQAQIARPRLAVLFVEVGHRSDLQSLYQLSRSFTESRYIFRLPLVLSPLLRGIPGLFLEDLLSHSPLQWCTCRLQDILHREDLGLQFVVDLSVTLSFRQFSGVSSLFLPPTVFASVVFVLPLFRHCLDT